MTKRIVPFGWLPGHWGLSGNTRKIAEIEYYYEGYERDKKILEVEYENDEEELKYKLAELNLKHGFIDEIEFKRVHAEIKLSGKARDEEILQCDYKEGKISDIEYEKELATIREESWVNLVELKTAQGNPSIGEITLDWNDVFIDELKEAGYEGSTDEDIVEMWFSDLCRNIAIEEFSGTGNFDDMIGTPYVESSDIGDGKREIK